jgi:penicillin-binding protein 2
MKRQFLLYFFFLLVGMTFVARLFYVQVIDKQYKLSGSNQAQQEIKIFPTRGYIFDRNGELLVTNQPAYDLLVVSNNVRDFDTASFCDLLNITSEQFTKYWDRMTKKRGYSNYKPNILVPLISKEEFAKIQEYLHDYKGFSVQTRILREYPRKSSANVVGYIGEVSESFIKRNPEYHQGDLIGKAGIDKAYENDLRGQSGSKFVLVDNHNRIKGPFLNGDYDKPAKPGYDLTSTIDIDLQILGEQLMSGKRGSIVAIEPSSGEILALVSAPGFDPNLLVGNKRSVNYKKLEADSINLPLFDRGLLAQYPPGSPFKVVNALIALQEGVITPSTQMTCHHGFHFGGLTVACHCSGGPMALRKSISKSCNNYYCTTFKRIIESYPNAHEGMNAWSNHVQSFGLGNYLNNDLPTGTKGLVPNSDYYDRVLGYTGWKAVTTISLGIGQGELLVTPIQLANMTAAIANKGYFYTPHIIKEVNYKPIEDERFAEPKKTTIDEAHFIPVIEGMYDVFEDGTARGSRLESIPMCGKTGTAENPHGQDHSIFIAFAPKDDPKIALAIIVENGYWGSRWAAPMASLMIEAYLHDSISRPKVYTRMVEGNLHEDYREQAIAKYGTDSILNFDN